MRAPIITDIMLGDGLAEYETTYINLKDPPFRAKGDGIADDTDALNYAIASGLPITAPDGAYRLTSPINIPDGTVINGDSVFSSLEGIYRTRFIVDHPGNGFEIVGLGHNILLSGFRVTKQGLTDEGIGIGIRIDAAVSTNATWQINNVMCDYLETGLYICDAIFPMVEKFTVEHCTYGMKFYNAAVNTGNHHGMFRDLWFRHNDYDIHIDGEFLMNEFDRIKFFNTHIRPIYAPGALPQTVVTTYFNKFRSLYFEHQGAEGVTDGLIDLRCGTVWLFEDVHNEGALPLFTSTTTAKDIIVRRLTDTGAVRGDLGIGNLKVNDSHAISVGGYPYRGRISDNADLAPRPFVMCAKGAIRSEVIGSQNIITPAYQSGVKLVNYITAAGQNLDGYAKTAINVTTGQADPYGGSLAFLLASTNVNNSLFKGGLNIDGAALAGRTFTVQIWAKAVDANSNISIRCDTVTVDSLAEARYYLDRDGWTLIWVTVTFSAIEAETTARIWFTIVGNGESVYLFEPCLYESSRPAIFTAAIDDIAAGIAFERNWGRYNQAGFTTFVDSDATPSVLANTKFKTNTTGVTITRFDDVVEGEEFIVISKGAIIFDTSTATRLIGSSVNITTADGDITFWICEVGGSAASVCRLKGFVDVSADNSAGA